MEFTLGLIGIAFAIGAYFLPAIIANRRQHENENAIAVLNLLTGWTVVGWIAALIWSLTAKRPAA